MSKSQPVPKVVASSSAALLGTAIITIMSLFGIKVDAKVAGAFGTIAVFAAGYVAPRSKIDEVEEISTDLAIALKRDPAIVTPLTVDDMTTKIKDNFNVGDITNLLLSDRSVALAKLAAKHIIK